MGIYITAAVRVEGSQGITYTAEPAVMHADSGTQAVLTGSILSDCPAGHRDGDLLGGELADQPVDL
jgi:hypothetical protein